MALVDNILSHQEAKEKIELLNKNASILKGNSYSSLLFLETEGQKYQKDFSSDNSISKIKELEYQLGVQILDSAADVVTLKDQMRETKGTFKKNIQQAEEFVSKLNEDKKKHKQKLSKIRKKELEKHQKLETDRKENEEKIAEKVREEKERRQAEYQERMEKDKLVKQKREEEFKKYKAKVKTNKNGYMHEKLEKEYQEKVLMPELEKKKQVLKEKREFFRPIDHKEIDEHQKQYEENFKIKLEQKKMEREKWYDDIGVGKYDPNKYQTKVLAKVIEETKGEEEHKLQEIEDRKRKAEKMNNYARIVKEMHWPEVSERKREEAENIKKLLEERNKRRSAPPKNRNQKPDSGSDNDRPKAIKKPSWNFHNPLIPKPKPKREAIIVDYLKEARVKRENQDGSSRHETGSDWKRIKDQDIDDKTKIELLKARTKLIEENAERKEKMNKYGGGTVEDNVDINDMLIDAIEMKLSILDQIE